MTVYIFPSEMSSYLRGAYRHGDRHVLPNCAALKKNLRGASSSSNCVAPLELQFVCVSTRRNLVEFWLCEGSCNCVWLYTPPGISDLDRTENVAGVTF